MVLEHYSQWLLVNQILSVQATQAQWSTVFTLCGALRVTTHHNQFSFRSKIIVNSFNMLRSLH